ncbi:iron-sulfur binding hydrogenase [Marinitoga litoralis]|jgi:predicted transcriptional regulator|uniref:iron-sulfur binding hydrogenase n=1 Tax=Marinitoga litoralis TaxID=570855 RepID=UPI0019608BCF|nr:iron-sulfur binding hydrogenase [Marinitoga litoralis]MBM7558933.1 putative transcriptional regulator [Marinitoga litoralis]
MILEDLLKLDFIEDIYIYNNETEIKNGYVGDLLSEIMRNSPTSSIWITHQTHPNIIAVASIVEANTIVIPKDFEFENETIEKAKENNINLLKSKYDIFKTVGLIYNILFGE